jgi:hypothetical protein
MDQHRRLEPLEPCNLSRARIEEIAGRIREQLVERYGYANGADLRPLVKQLGGTIEYRSLLDWDGQDGSIEVEGPRRFRIRLPHETTVLRDRFTTAHELAHYFLHANQGKRPGAACRSGVSERIEWEANWFAGEFLMPADEFVQVHREAGGDPASLAGHFAVSVEAALVREDVLRRAGRLDHIVVR